MTVLISDTDYCVQEYRIYSGQMTDRLLSQCIIMMPLPGLVENYQEVIRENCRWAELKPYRASCIRMQWYYPHFAQSLNTLVPGCYFDAICCCLQCLAIFNYKYIITND